MDFIILFVFYVLFNMIKCIRRVKTLTMVVGALVYIFLYWQIVSALIFRSISLIRIYLLFLYVYIYKFGLSKYTYIIYWMYVQSTDDCIIRRPDLMQLVFILGWAGRARTTGTSWSTRTRRRYGGKLDESVIIIDVQ